MVPSSMLLDLSRRGLIEAELTSDPGVRYATAHLAALRAAAAVLACRARPAKRRRLVSAWELLKGVSPELGEWADFFAAGAGKRAAVEAGLPAASAREADDLVRDAQTFLGLVEGVLGVTGQPVLA